LESPELYRRWSAIVAISAVLQQKVWLLTSAPLYPNLYCFLVGPPGVGKSRSIAAVGKYLRDIEGLHIAPTSMTGASLVDALVGAKTRLAYGVGKDDYLDFNSMVVMPDELSALMHEYDRALVATLTTFYDCLPYEQTRRTADIKIKIAHPQLSILAGDTTSHLLKTLPDGAWDQGLMSRTILIFSDDRPMQDDIFTSVESFSEDLRHDLFSIFSLQGQFVVDDTYRKAFNDWRHSGRPPTPTHPRLLHYCSRRDAHVLKLSMVSCVDRGDELKLSKLHFDRALGWLTDAEQHMPYTFQVTSSVDSRTIDETLHWMGDRWVSGSQLLTFMCERMAVTSAGRTIELMEASRMIECKVVDRYGTKHYKRLGLT
jgi:hypothetical protein